MRKKVIHIALFASLLLAFLAGPTEIFAKGSGSSGPIDVGILIPETHVERWIRDGAELKEGFEAAGLKAAVAYGDADQGKQNRQIEDMITNGAKLLVIGAVNQGVVEAVDKATDEGVHVIAYDRLITGTDKYDYYISFDNFKVGQLQGKAIVEALKLDSASKPANIVLFSGSATDNNARFFFDGAMEVLKPYIQSKKLAIVGPAPLSSSDPTWSQTTTPNWNAEKAQTRMENLLSGNLRNVMIDAALAPNDTIARALITALEQDSKYASKLPIVTGQDGEVLSIKWIKNKKQYMTVFKDTRELAQGAVEVALAVYKGEVPKVKNARVDKKTYDTGSKIITAYLMSIHNVTADNYKEILIDSGYYTEKQIDQK